MVHNQEQLATKIILVVEDDTGISSFLNQAIVQETSHQIVLVRDSIQALKAIKDVRPDLFILNYRLPGMNGIELYDQFHAISGLEEVPAIMISATLPKHELARRSIVGMKKPVELDDLLEAIEKLIA